MCPENDDANKPQGSLHQFKVIVHLEEGEVVKFRYNKTTGEANDVWVGWLDNAASYTDKIINDGSDNNIKVLATGTYTFYVKMYSDGGGSIWIGGYVAD